MRIMSSMALTADAAVKPIAPHKERQWVGPNGEPFSVWLKSCLPPGAEFVGYEDFKTGKVYSIDDIERLERGEQVTVQTRLEKVLEAMESVDSDVKPAITEKDLVNGRDSEGKEEALQ